MSDEDDEAYFARVAARLRGPSSAHYAAMQASAIDRRIAWATAGVFAATLAFVFVVPNLIRAAM